MNNSLCKYCFKVLEKEIDDDRYYFQCPDMNCLYWENGTNEQVQRITEGIREHFDELQPLKWIEVKASIEAYLVNVNEKVMQISKLRDDQRGL
jgi:coproporphyrinogen III oxidase-like Fe-S oxidoreductase